MVTLVIPFGAHDTPIGHGTVDFQPNAYRADVTDPNSPWLIDVPAHVATPLCHNAGFYPMPQETVPTFTGTARVYHPDGPRACSVGGESYEPDANGVNTVPSEYAAVLMESFGFQAAADLPAIVKPAARAPKKS